MTDLKVNIVRKPTIKVKVLPRFPSSVSAVSPILLSTVGGNYTFSFNLSALGLGTAIPHNWINAISAGGLPSFSQPDFSDISGSVPNAKMATMAAFTFKANNTSGAATPTDITIDGLTLKASPAAGDEVIIWDVAGAALKKTTASGISSSAGVSSIAGNTGAFTLSRGITNTANAIQLSLTNATLQTSPASPTPTTSAAGVMMGLGSTCVITPVYSGRVKIQVYGSISNSIAGNGVKLTLRFGTGTAPVNGAAAVGTLIGNVVEGDSGLASMQVPFFLGGIITGLTLSTQIWIDVTAAVQTTGTGAVLNPTCTAMEF